MNYIDNSGKDAEPIVYGKDDLSLMMAKFKKKKPFKLHMDEAKESEGYSEDWPRVINSYVNGSSFYLADQLYTPKIHTANARVQLKENNEHLKKYSQQYVESLINPRDSLDTFRTIQYLYTMGLNFSSAAVQLSSLFTFMPAYLNIASGSALKTANAMRKAVGLTNEFRTHGLKILKESAFDPGDESVYNRLLKSGKLSPEQITVLKELYDRGILLPALSEEFTGLQGGPRGS